MSEASEMSEQTPQPKRTPWLSILALLLLWAAVLSNAMWLWGLLFIGWAAPDLWAKKTQLVEVIHRSEHPWLYWLTVMSWLVIGVYLISLDLWPSPQPPSPSPSSSPTAGASSTP